MFAGETLSQNLTISNTGDKALGFHVSYQGTEVPENNLTSMARPQFSESQKRSVANINKTAVRTTPKASSVHNTGRPIAIAGGIGDRNSIDSWYQFELDQLHNTLVDLGYDYVDVYSVAEARQAGASTLIVRSGATGAFDGAYPWDEMNEWVQDGGGLIQLFDWIDYFSNDFMSIPMDPIILENLAVDHPIMSNLPSSWSGYGYFRYANNSNDYIGYVSDDSMPNLVRGIGIDRVVSATSVGNGRAVYIGFNVYGRDAGANDVKLLDNALKWAQELHWLTAKPTRGVIDGGSSMELEILFDGRQMQAQDLTASLIVNSNASLQPEIKIPVSLSVVQPTPPQIAVQPTSLDFTQNSSEISSQILTVKNDGESPLEFNINGPLAPILAIDPVGSDDAPAYLDLSSISGGRTKDSMALSFNFESYISSADISGLLLLDTDQDVNTGQLSSWWAPESDIGVDYMVIFEPDLFPKGSVVRWVDDFFLSDDHHQLTRYLPEGIPQSIEIIGEVDIEIDQNRYSFQIPLQMISDMFGLPEDGNLDLVVNLLGDYEMEQLPNHGHVSVNDIWAGTAINSWLNITPSAGLLTRDQPVMDLLVTADASNLSAGVYTADIDFDNNSSNLSPSIPITLTVTAPVLTISPEIVDLDLAFDQTDNSASLILGNDGNGALDFEIVEAAYIRPIPSFGIDGLGSEAKTSVPPEEIKVKTRSLPLFKLAQSAGMGLIIRDAVETSDLDTGADIMAIEAGLTQDALTLRLTYAAPPDLQNFQPLVYLDVDQDGTPDYKAWIASDGTGINSLILAGDEYLDYQPVAFCETYLSGTSVEFSIPLQSIQDEGEINLYVSVEQTLDGSFGQVERVPTIENSWASTSPDPIPWLTLSSVRGQVLPNDNADLNLIISTSELRDGLHQAELNLISNDPMATVQIITINVVVTGAPSPNIELSMANETDEISSITIDGVLHGQVVDRTLTIENTGGPGLDFTISVAISEEGDPAVDWLTVTPASGSIGKQLKREVGLVFDASRAEAGQHSARLVIQHNIVDTSFIEIPVDFSVVAAGIEINPSSFDFGSVAFGTEPGSSTETRIMTITNTGDAPLSYRILDKEATFNASPSAVVQSRSTQIKPESSGSGILNTDNKRSLNRLHQLLDSLEPSQLVFREDFEDGGRYSWTTETYDDPYTIQDESLLDLWHPTDENFNSPFTSYWCSNGDSYVDDISNALVSPPIDLVNQQMTPITLHFFENYDTEPGYDFVMVDISTDDGTSWQHLRGAPYSSEALSGNSGGWTQSTIDISAYAGYRVHLRFHFRSDYSISGNEGFTGWWVDDVVVTTGVIPWLQVSPITGEIAANSTKDVELTVDAYGLMNGIYTANLLIKNNAPITIDRVDSSEEISVQMIVSDAASPMLAVFPKELKPISQSGRLVQRKLTVQNIGGPGLNFEAYSLEDNQRSSLAEGAPTVNHQAVAAAIADQTDGADILRQRWRQLDRPSTSEKQLIEPASIIVPPQAEIFPQIDGQFDADNWNDSVTVEVFDIGRNSDLPIGRVYAKVVAQQLYILADYFAITGQSNITVSNVVSSLSVDLDLDRQADGTIGLEFDQNTVTEMFDFPVQSSGVGIGGSPNQAEDHLIFEYEIPLSGMGLSIDSRLAVSFLLGHYQANDEDGLYDDLQMATSGEWPNVSSQADFLAPERWGWMYFRGVPWLKIDPYAGNLGYRDEQMIDLTFNLDHLQAGIYKAQLVVTPDNGSDIFVPIELTVTSPELELQTSLELSIDLSQQTDSWQDESIEIQNSGDGLLTFKLIERGASFEALPPQQTTPQSISQNQQASWSQNDRKQDLAALEIQEMPTETLVSPNMDSPNLRTIIWDPVGDSYGLQPDIVSVEASTSMESMTLKVNFSQPMGAEEIYGWIDLDTDQNPATGYPWHDIGVDYDILLSFSEPGLAYVVEIESGELRGPIQMVVDGNSLWLTTPWSMIGGGGSDLDITFDLGNAYGPTDEAPDQGHGTVPFSVEIPWLVLHQSHGQVPPTGTLNLPFSIDASSLGNGIHRAQLTVQHNVPMEPDKEVEVVVTVTGNQVPQLYIEESELQLMTRVGEKISHDMQLLNIGGPDLQFSLSEMSWRPDLIQMNQIVTDPLGDTDDSADVVGIMANGNAEQLVIEVQFAEFLASNPFGLGRIFLDTDQDPTTGLATEELNGGSEQDLGVDYLIDLTAIGQGITATIYDTMTFESLGDLFVTTKPQALSVSIPLGWLGEDDGNLNVATVFDNDLAPDTGSGQIDASVLINQIGQIGDAIDIDWLAVEANSGQIGPYDGQSITIKIDPPDRGGRYYAALRIDHNSLDSTPQIIPITLGVTNQLAVLYVVPASDKENDYLEDELEEKGRIQLDEDGNNEDDWLESEESTEKEKPDQGRKDRLMMKMGEPILLLVDQPFRFQVYGHDIFGHQVYIDPQEIRWQVLSEGLQSVADIGNDGQLETHSPGQGRVQAQVGKVRGQSAPITVIRHIKGDSAGGEVTVDYPYGRPDGQVDIHDLVNLGAHWQQRLIDTTASANEFRSLDIAGPEGVGQTDGIIDIYDLIVLADNFGLGVSISAAPALIASLPKSEKSVALIQAIRNDTTAQRDQSIRTIVGSEFGLNFNLTGVDQIKAYSFDLSYDPDQISVISQSTEKDGNEKPNFVMGDLLQAGQNGSVYQIARQLTVGPRPDTVNVTATVLGQLAQNGQELGQLQLQAKSMGQSSLTLKNLILVTESGQQLTVPEVRYQLISHPPVEATQLLQNYPNPFNPETWIPFELKEPGSVLITIYDTEGETVRLLDLGHQVAGPYRGPNDAAYWDGRNRQGEVIASGVYFYHLQTNKHNSIRKMVILK